MNLCGWKKSVDVLLVGNCNFAAAFADVLSHDLPDKIGVISVQCDVTLGGEQDSGHRFAAAVYGDVSGLGHDIQRSIAVAVQGCAVQIDVSVGDQCNGEICVL